jgi:hypothetical protein
MSRCANQVAIDPPKTLVELDCVGKKIIQQLSYERLIATPNDAWLNETRNFQTQPEVRLLIGFKN